MTEEHISTDRPQAQDGAPSRWWIALATFVALFPLQRPWTTLAPSTAGRSSARRPSPGAPEGSWG
jgi:hypothetical protein